MDPDSSDEKSGLIKDYIISKIGNREVDTVEDVRAALPGDNSELRMYVSSAGKKFKSL